MLDTASKLLALPFEKGSLVRPADQKKALIWNAPFHHGFKEFQNLETVQSFRPIYDQWAQVGYSPLSSIEDIQTSYSYVLCAVVKQKDAAQYQLAYAAQTLEEGGILIAAAANDAGGKRLENWFKSLGLSPQSLSKSKCRVVWAVKNDIDQAVIDQWIAQGSLQKMMMGDVEWTTQAGIFGWNKIDQGSNILAHNLPEILTGRGADFGCGYGFLSHHALSTYPKIKQLHCYDTDYQALHCACKNLEGFNTPITYDWLDLTTGNSLPSALDFIIMNPPFHDQKEVSSDIGQKFITNAAKSLRQRGQLYLVANAHLPYEKILNDSFSSVEKLDEQQGFKIFHATK